MCPQSDRPCDRFYTSPRGCGYETCEILDRALRAERERDAAQQRAYHWRDIAYRAEIRLREGMWEARAHLETADNSLAEALSDDAYPEDYAL